MSGGELTHLDYWPTGLLKKVTNPDASFIEYTYDAAHRLTQIKDGALNKIVYTLDNAGNRTAENTFDPGNALRRTHTRVFNTLNQLWKDVNATGTASGHHHLRLRQQRQSDHDQRAALAQQHEPVRRAQSPEADHRSRLRQSRCSATTPTTT